jgi:hypothetical protein
VITGASSLIPATPISGRASSRGKTVRLRLSPASSVTRSPFRVQWLKQYPLQSWVKA